jgi:hypothetical protein
MSEPSELATLVETERRLDAAVASAREAARSAREAAHADARAAAADLDARIERERVRIANAVAAELAEREHRLEAHAIAMIARYEAIAGDAADRLAQVLAGRLLSLLEEEP